MAGQFGSNWKTGRGKQIVFIVIYLTLIRLDRNSEQLLLSMGKIGEGEVCWKSDENDEMLR